LLRKIHLLPLEKALKEQLTIEMREAAKALEFEKAAYIRDRIKELKNQK
jgi:excinuclease ABC subunit B